MKKLMSIFFVFVSLTCFGQKEIIKKAGTVEVQIIEHTFKHNSDNKKLKSKTNKRNRPSTKMFYQSNGNILKRIQYGTNHSYDLRIIKTIEVFEYEAAKLLSSIEYYVGCKCKKKVTPFYYTKYKHDEIGNLVEESIYDYDNDSLIDKSIDVYDIHSNNIKTISGDIIYERKYNSNNKIVNIKQYTKNGLNWEEEFIYQPNKRINRTIPYAEREEIKKYNNKNLIIEIENKHNSEKSFKKVIFYDKKDIIKKIEYYEFKFTENTYELHSYFDIKVKSKVILNSKVVKIINNDVISEL